MNHSWDELICHYFKDIVLQTLEKYLRSKGFDSYNETKVGGLIFRTKDDFFIEISYEPESSPKYAPTVIVGNGKNKYDNKGNPNCVPLWFITPENSLARSYSSWKFSTEEQLKDTLIKIKNELLEKYALPLCNKISSLQDEISKFNNG